MQKKPCDILVKRLGHALFQGFVSSLFFIRGAAVVIGTVMDFTAFSPNFSDLDKDNMKLISY
jgi:hypothetical protein